MGFPYLSFSVRGNYGSHVRKRFYIEAALGGSDLLRNNLIGKYTCFHAYPIIIGPDCRAPILSITFNIYIFRPMFKMSPKRA